jgi:hypothetical protein
MLGRHKWRSGGPNIDRLTDKGAQFHLGADGPARHQEAIMQITLHIDGQADGIDVPDPDIPLLYALRDDLGFRSPRFGCVRLRRLPFTPNRVKAALERRA